MISFLQRARFALNNWSSVIRLQSFKKSSTFASRIEFRPIEQNEVFTISRLTNEEGWNNDITYLQACYSLDGMNWYGAAVDGKIIGSCASYEYEDGRTAMVGLLVLDRRYRGASIGRSLLDKAYSPLAHVNVLCTSVQSSRMKHLFYPSFRMRMWSYKKYKGSSLSESKAILHYASREPIKIVSLSDVSFDKVAHYDASFSSTKSVLTTFFKQVIIGQGSRVIVALNSVNDVVGYAVLRKVNQVWRFAPIYGNSTEIGCKLFTTLLDFVPEGDLISVQTFDDNTFMNALLNYLGFEKTLSAALMFSKHSIEVPVERVFGIANFEFTPF